MTKNQFETNNNLFTIVSSALIGISFVAITAIVFIALHMSKTINEVSAENSRRLVESALQLEVDRVAVSLRDYAEWPIAHTWVSERDDEAVDENIGSGAVYDATFDVIYLISAEAEPLYAFKTDGDSSDVSVVELNSAKRFADQMKEIPLSPYKVISEYTYLNNRLVIASLGRIQPYDIDGKNPEEFTIMVGAIWLSEEKLEKIANNLLLKEMKLFPLDKVLPNHFGQFIFNGYDGQPIAKIIWRLSKPGDMSLHRVIPIILAVSFIILVMSAIIWWFFSRQTKAFLQEHHRARNDQLTGVYNRNGLETLVESDKIQKMLRDSQLAIIYIDLNDFKTLNDTEGHDAGDKALRITAKRLKSSIRKEDYIVRLGGDEFICIITGAPALNIASQVVERFCEKALLPIRLGKALCTVNASIGVAVATSDIDWETLLMQADTAMYKAKSGHENPVFYKDGM